MRQLFFKSQAGPVLGLCIASGATGTARRALAEFTKMVQGKRVAYTAHISHEWQPLQKICGESASKIHAAELVLYRVADDIDDYARRGEKMPMELRGRIRADIAMVPRLCRDAVIDPLDHRWAPPVFHSKARSNWRPAILWRRACTAFCFMMRAWRSMAGFCSDLIPARRSSELCKNMPSPKEPAPTPDFVAAMGQHVSSVCVITAQHQEKAFWPDGHRHEFRLCRSATAAGLHQQDRHQS